MRCGVYGLVYGIHFYIVYQTSAHMTPGQRRLNVDATLHKVCVHAGIVLDLEMNTKLGFCKPVVMILYRAIAIATISPFMGAAFLISARIYYFSVQ